MKSTNFTCPICRRISVIASPAPVADGGVADRYQCKMKSCSFSCPVPSFGNIDATSGSDQRAYTELYRVNASANLLPRPERTAAQKADDDAFLADFEIEVPA